MGALDLSTKEPAAIEDKAHKFFSRVFEVVQRCLAAKLGLNESHIVPEGSFH